MFELQTQDRMFAGFVARRHLPVSSHRWNTALWTFCGFLGKSVDIYVNGTTFSCQQGSKPPDGAASKHEVKNSRPLASVYD